MAAKLVGFSVARLHRKTEVKSQRTCEGFMCLINMTFISTHRCRKLSVLVCVSLSVRHRETGILLASFKDA